MKIPQFFLYLETLCIIAILAYFVFTPQSFNRFSQDFMFFFWISSLIFFTKYNIKSSIKIQ